MAYFIKIETFNDSSSDYSIEQKREIIKQHKKWVKRLQYLGEKISSGYLVDNKKNPGGGGLLILEAESFASAQSLIEFHC